MKKILVFILGVILCASISACSISTANFQNLKMASDVDKNTKTAIIVTSKFETTTPVIYIAGEYRNTTPGTVIKTEWLYLEDNTGYTIDTAELTTKKTDASFYFELSKPASDWPKGNYQVKLYFDDNLSKSVNFSVE